MASSSALSGMRQSPRNNLSQNRNEVTANSPNWESFDILWTQRPASFPGRTHSSPCTGGRQHLNCAERTRRRLSWPAGKGLEAMSVKHAPVLIIGSGPAGYTAAIYAARAMLKPVLIAGLQQGGQLMITTDVENYPGFADPIQGPWLMERDAEAGRACRHRDRQRHHHSRPISDVRPFRLTGDSGTVYTADALIIATGAQAKWLGMPERSRPSRASAYRPAPPATASSIAARTWS